MSLKDKFKNRTTTKIVTILGDKVEVPSFSMGAKLKWKDDYAAITDDMDKAAGMFCDLFKDPETKEPIFTPEFVTEEMTDEDMILCMKAVFIPNVETIEKN